MTVSTQQKPDPTLVKRHVSAAQSGDTRAFDRLVDWHNALVNGVVQTYILDPETREDLSQEVWIKAWRKLKSFGFKSQFSTWLYRLAVYTCWDWNKREKRARIRREAALPELMDSGVERTRPDHILRLGELEACLEATLQDLPPKLRQAYDLMERGFSMNEIATATDVATGTVGSRIHAARHRLRECVSSNYLRAS